MRTDTGNTPGRPSITIIVPTTCESSRRIELTRAITSVLDQRDVSVRLVVVINGRRVDSSMLEGLRDDSRLTVIYLPDPDLREARARGRREVATEYFGFLDDDDEYLPGALRLRCAPMIEDGAIDFVATNGYRGANRIPYLRNPQGISADPVAALFDQNWLASCAGLFRTASCDQKFFDELPDFMEWTALAVRLLVEGRRMAYIDECTFRINDTPVSLSKTESYRTATVHVINNLLRLNLSRNVRKKLHRMRAAAWHDLSMANLRQGRKLQAWKCHLKSIATLHGLQYLPYTRHLIT